LRKLTQSLQERGGLKSIEIVEEKVMGEIATVEMKITFGDEEDSTPRVDLLKENGEWKLDLKRLQ